MADSVSSTNMLLPVPVVGVAPGPAYATDVNSCLTIIDGHDHTPGFGVQITPSGLNISSDLTMAQNNLTNIRSLRLYPQNAPLAGVSDLGCIYESGVDLYYNDGNGNQVRITQSGGVAGTTGSIANLTSPASATYVSGSATFVWQSDVNTPANMDGASYILRNLVASSKGLTLAPPNSMASDYTIVLPTLPASTLPVSISSGGTMSAAQITQAQLVTAVSQALVTAGDIIPYGGSSAPSGYLLCDGGAVSRATYATLFTAIGTSFGPGDGSTTFNLPDMRNMFPRVSGAAAPVFNNWTAYTPTFQGFGTVTSVSMWWRQTGQNIEVRGRWLCGITTATEARIGLPSGYTVSATLVPTYEVLGTVARQASASAPFYAQATGGNTYFNVGDPSTGLVTPRNGSGVMVTGDTGFILASVPVSEFNSYINAIIKT